MEERSFVYKLDFLYQQTLLYTGTLLLYGGIRGTVAEDRFTLVFRDPLLIIIVFFCFISLGTLAVNLFRKRILIVREDGLEFVSRYRRRILLVSDIEWIFIGREKSVRTAGTSRLVVIKPKNKRQSFRIRIGRYERSKELLLQLERLAGQVPHKPQRKSLEN